MCKVIIFFWPTWVHKMRKILQNNLMSCYNRYIVILEIFINTNWCIVLTFILYNYNIVSLVVIPDLVR